MPDFYASLIHPEGIEPSIPLTPFPRHWRETCKNGVVYMLKSRPLDAHRWLPCRDYDPDLE